MQMKISAIICAYNEEKKNKKICISGWSKSFVFIQR